MGGMLALAVLMIWSASISCSERDGHEKEKGAAKIGRRP